MLLAAVVLNAANFWQPLVLNGSNFTRLFFGYASLCVINITLNVMP